MDIVGGHSFLVGGLNICSYCPLKYCFGDGSYEQQI